MNLEELNKKINEQDKVIVDFWAPWCGPCRMLSPILEDIKTSSNVEIIKVNVDENEELANEFKIMNIPALFIYKNGQLVNKIVGLKSKESIMELLK